MALNVNSINNIKDYSQIKEMIEDFSNNYSELMQQKNQIANLFEGNFALMGANTDQTYAIEQEISELQALITTEKAKIQKWQNIILDCENDINAAKDELDGAITDYVRTNESNINDVNNQIALITASVLNQYARGEISEEDVSKSIQSQVSSISHNYNLDDSKINRLTDRITDNVNKVTSLINQLHSAYNKVSTATSALQLLNEMYQMQIMPLGTYATEKAGKKPVYTPKKSAYVDELYSKYHATATAGQDQYSSGNKQIQNLADALGIKDANGNYIKSEEGEDTYPKSILQEMYNQGFSFKEAMYACEYIFGFSKGVMNYDCETDNLTLALGHDRDAKTTLNSFANQAKTIWGNGAQRPEPTDDTTPSNTTPSNTTPSNTTPSNTTPSNTTPSNTTPSNTTPSDTTPSNTTPSTTVKRVDPIGWSVGNTTFDFVIDRDKDKKFDGPNEFLGAQKGINELISLDKDGNGLVEGDELDNLVILSTNHENKAFGFLTAKDANIKSIDLAKLFDENGNQKDNVSTPHANINGNVVHNTFDIAFENNDVLTGYQSMDDVSYLQAVYGDRYGKDMVATLDYTRNRDNKDALESIRAFGTNTENVDTIGERFRQKVQSIMSSFNAKKEEASRLITVQKRELKQNLSNSIHRAENEVQDIIELRDIQSLQDAEYEERELETQRQALERQKSTLELQLEDIYNKEKTEPNKYTQTKIELKRKLEEINEELEALNS